VSHYAFVTDWELAAPLPAVWELIAHPLAWPAWWRGVERVEELRPGDAEGRGSVLRYTWRSRLPYRLRFDMRTTEVARHERLCGEASGELRGVGRWTFAEALGVTRVRYEWEVEATKRWMRLLAPVARPAFEWNHDVVMGWGEAGLRARLAATAAASAPRA
jgi:hypothetical protein